MSILNRKNKGVKNRGMKKRRFRELLHSCERAYGVKLSLRNKEELSLWMSSRDPYLAELFCE